MINDQKQLWNDKYSQRKIPLAPNTFAKEVEQLISKHSKILELGCGNNQDPQYFADKGHSVLATDFAESIISERKSSQTDNLKFDVLDISKPMPFERETFDVIYSRLALHYFTDKVTKEIFQELHRILKPQGYLCFICKSPEDPKYGRGTLIEKDMFEARGHVRHFFSEAYAAECVSAFRVIKLKSYKEVFNTDESGFVQVIAQKAENNS